RILETPGRVVDRIDTRNTGVNDHRGVQRSFQAQVVGDALVGPAVQDLVLKRHGEAKAAGGGVEVVPLHDQGTDLEVRRVLGIDDENVVGAVKGHTGNRGARQRWRIGDDVRVGQVAGRRDRGAPRAAAVNAGLALDGNVLLIGVIVG